MATETLGKSADLHIVVGDSIVLSATFEWLTDSLLAVQVGVNDLGQMDAYIFHLMRTIDALREGKFNTLSSYDEGSANGDAPSGEEPPFPF